MEGSKIYLQPKVTLLNAVNDLIELQKGKLTHSDTRGGQIHFTVRMYYQKWEIRFLVADIGGNRCRVQLEIEGGEEKHRAGMIQREFALLDSMLLTLAQIEITEKPE